MIGTWRNYVWLALVLLLASCAEDDAPRTVLTATIDASFDTGRDDTYIIIHNTDGEFIDHKPIESGETVEFTTAAKFPGDKLDVTIARIYPDPIGGGLAYMWSYLEVPAGQSWTLTYKQVQYGPNREYAEGGEYTVSVTNLNSVVARSVSDRNNTTQYGFSSKSTLTSSINTKNPKHLLSLDDGTGPRYEFINDLKAGNAYTIDFNQMKKFDKTLKVPFAEPGFAYAHVMGYETLEDFKYLTGYVLYYTYADGTRRNSMDIGYLDNMAKFRTEVKLSTSKYMLSYVSRGAMPSGITFPQPSAFEFQEKFVHNVSYTSSVPVTYRVSYFMSRNLTSTTGAHWYFYAPPGRAKQPRFADVLFDKYPLLDTREFRHYSTTFYTKTWEYETFLSREFGGKVRKAEEDEYEDVAVILY